MKFLILALCVCAASAASTFGNGYRGKGYKGFPSASVAPVDVAAKAVETAAAVVVNPAAVAAAATYGAGAATYQTAKQVVNAYSNDAEAQIVRSDSEVNSNGYQYTYESSNGISGEASGAYEKIGEAGAVVSQGAYRYTAPDGTPVYITYTADENGFHPKSDILPVGPPTPLAIVRALEYIAAKNSEQKTVTRN